MKTAIRAWRMEDAVELQRALNNPHILKNLRDGIPYPYTLQDAKAYITEVLHAERDSVYTWAVTVDGAVAGSIGIFRGGNIHFRTAELGYYLAEPYWGKGIMTSAVRAACRFIFAETDIIRIFAEPFAHNIASCKVLEKTGFEFEGTLRKNAVKDGAILDMRLYSLVR